MRSRAWRSDRRRFGPAVVFGLSLCVSLSVAPHRLPAADLAVVMDEAKLIRLPDKVATIVIGNPMIADVAVQPGGIMVVTGKGYGTTNVVVLDRAGSVLMEKSIEVQGPSAHVVVMYRGIERETYSCTPNCERRIMIGDSGVYFDTVVTQAGSRNGLASGAPPPAPK
jgi:Pilus formation protein N terminal region